MTYTHTCFYIISWVFFISVSDNENERKINHMRKCLFNKNDNNNIMIPIVFYNNNLLLYK